MLSLSALIITKNEEANLEECLASLKGWVQEIIIVDGQSQDNTVAIAKQHGAIISQPSDWPGFGPQKNRALAMATSDWVLSIDADERISPELALEISQLMHGQPRFSAYEISRMSWYCGRFIRHSGWQPDRVLRLFDRQKARFSDDLVHERVLYADPVGRLQHQIIHYSYRSYEQVIDKMNAYSSASAIQLHLRGKKTSVWKALGHGLWTFMRTYFFRGGFLDGQQGLALAISNAEGSYYKHVKLAYLNMNKP